MFDRFKIIVGYLFAIPLALILGFLAASPGEMTFILIGLLLFVLASPLFLRWHHALMIIFWNSAFNAYFLPGQPYFWLLLATISFSLSMLNHVMGRKPFISVPEMTRPLVFLTIAVLITALYRGGIGLKFMGGSTHGGRYYIFILGSIMGYFAFTGGQVPLMKSNKMAVLFFLSGATYILGNAAYTLGSSFYFMFYLVPSSLASNQAASDLGLTSIDRIQGLAQTCTAIVCALLSYYGMRELFRPTKPWRLLFLVITLGASLFSGFRSTLLFLVMILVIQFYLEGLHRTRALPILLAVGSVLLGIAIIFASHLPLSVQRSLSFLPINVDAEARADAIGSSEWRLQMWALVFKDVPKYLLVGKGYAFDPTEMELTTQAIHMNMLSTFEEALLAGDYHSGTLSVLMPFGLLGAIGFVWTMGAGGWVLYSNFRWGDPALRRINCVLLSFYLAQSISFIFIFGAFNSQLFIFLGVIGLSVSFNGGVQREVVLVPERARRALTPAYAIELD
jgi:hypothetical protein